MSLTSGLRCLIGQTDRVVVSFQQHGCWRGHRLALTTHLFCTCSRAIYRILSRSAIYILVFHLGMSIDTSCTECIIGSWQWWRLSGPLASQKHLLRHCHLLHLHHQTFHFSSLLEVCSKNSIHQHQGGHFTGRLWQNHLPSLSKSARTESWLNLHFVVLRRFLCLGRCLQILPLLPNVSIQTYRKNPKLKRTS